jgi:hypothetical protein
VTFSSLAIGCVPTPRLVIEPYNAKSTYHSFVGLSHKLVATRNLSPNLDDAHGHMQDGTNGSWYCPLVRSASSATPTTASVVVIGFIKDLSDMVQHSTIFQMFNGRSEFLRGRFSELQTGTVATNIRPQGRSCRPALQAGRARREDSSRCLSAQLKLLVRHKLARTSLTLARVGCALLSKSFPPQAPPHYCRQQCDYSSPH